MTMKMRNYLLKNAERLIERILDEKAMSKVQSDGYISKQDQLEVIKEIDIKLTGWLIKNNNLSHFCDESEWAFRGVINGMPQYGFVNRLELLNEQIGNIKSHCTMRKHISTFRNNAWHIIYGL